MKKYGLVALSVVLLLIGTLAAMEMTKAAFTRSTIDIGVVVSDLEKSAKFYTEAIGFTEVQGFSVSAEVGRDAGLTDNQAINVRVFVLADEPTATRLKLMEFPDVKSKKPNHKYIHSTLGYSYLTLLVADTDAALAKAAAAGVKPVKAPYKLGGDTHLTLVKDPDGNIIEFVGPK